MSKKQKFLKHALVMRILEKTMKDCAFQYATGIGVVMADTCLVTRADAEEMWQKHIDQFKQHVKEGRDPEMAIWIGMKDDSDYHTTAEHWCGQDFTVRNGEMFSLIPVA